MNWKCLICKEKLGLVKEGAPFLCKHCVTQLEACKAHPEFHSLFRYNEPLRKLILKVKIEGDHRALYCLRHLFLNAPLSRKLAADSSLIIPAPSSLWSRLHGRFDLAYLLSSALAKETQRTMRRAPLRLYWRISKRAKLLHRELVHPSLVEDGSSCPDIPQARVLIVDDVVTSGYTLQSTGAAFTDSTHVQYLTLASALPS